MDRREFLKNSIAGLLFASLEFNPTLKTVVDVLDISSPDVLLYLIRNKKEQWKVRGTKWVDIAKQKLDSNKVDLETFKPLEIVSNDIANSRKNELWIQYNCSGEKGGPLNVVISKQRALKAHKSPKMINYINSPEWVDNWYLGKIAGGKSYGKILGKKNVETGWLDSIRPKESAFKTFTKEQFKEYTSMGGKAAAIVNLESGQVHRAQQLAAKSRRKKVICIETNKTWVSLKECAKEHNLHYGSLKNKLIENGRINDTSFRYADN